MSRHHAWTSSRIKRGRCGIWLSRVFIVIGVRVGIGIGIVVDLAAV